MPCNNELNNHRSIDQSARHRHESLFKQPMSVDIPERTQCLGPSKEFVHIWQIDIECPCVLTAWKIISHTKMPLCYFSEHASVLSHKDSFPSDIFIIMNCFPLNNVKCEMPTELRIQMQVSRAWQFITSHNIFWGVITFPCHWRSVEILIVSMKHFFHQVDGTCMKLCM